MAVSPSEKKNKNNLLWRTWWNTSTQDEMHLFSKFYSDALVIWEAYPSKRSNTMLLSIEAELKVSQTWDVTGLKETIQHQ